MAYFFNICCASLKKKKINPKPVTCSIVCLCLVYMGRVFWFCFWISQVLVLILLFEVESGWLKNEKIHLYQGMLL